MKNHEGGATKVERRALLLALPTASLSLGSSLVACRNGEAPASRSSVVETHAVTPSQAAGPLASVDSIADVFPLGSPPWRTFDPFLFCVHHDDAYPTGNELLGPRASLVGRRLGNDFAGKDGWSMYHGDVVPGFPRHPHRGFETVTVTRRGFVDHSDSLGARARYGQGDVQWMTAGRGIEHAEMFPLLDRAGPNHCELLQIWINLPASSKFVEPHFSMFWEPAIPDQSLEDEQGRVTRVRVVAGRWRDVLAPAPPPDSWAANLEHGVAIWTLEMDPGAAVALPPAAASANRTLYFYRGRSVSVAAREFQVGVGLRLRAEAEISLVNGPEKSELLLLQGEPIGEPVVKHGPFVMNSAEQIRQAYADYRKTRFGDWPWAGNDPVHGEAEGRFAAHADGRMDRAPT